VSSKAVPAELLADELRALERLLADPHPGLFTWSEMFARRLERVRALAAEALEHGVTGLSCVLLLVALAGCGSIALIDAGDALEAHDAGGADQVVTSWSVDGALEVHDAAAECPPVALSCSSGAGACPQGMIVAKRSDCGGAPYALCCPVADCELAACVPCPECP